MTPAEALAKALRAAPNVTGRVARLFADATPAEAARVAANLADMIQQMTGETWLPEDVTALAEGITARPPIGSVRIDPASLPGGDGASLATHLAAAQHALASMRRELRTATKDLRAHQDILAALWLYVDWRWLTKQLPTEDKERLATALEQRHREVDAEQPEEEPFGPADRWWLCPTCGISIRAKETDGPHERCHYARNSEAAPKEDD